MGCDIHVYFEEKRHVNGEEKWVNRDLWELNPYYGDDHEPQYLIAPLYGDRNYTLFSILAGVRNYGNNEPMAKPKGIPEDCSDVVRAEKELWGRDGHTHSWFTVAELLGVKEKYAKTKHSGYVPNDEVEKVRCGEFPTWWCQDTNQKDRVTWCDWECQNDSFGNLIEAIKTQAERLHITYNDEQFEKKADKMRIVFWFDN